MRLNVVAHLSNQVGAPGSPVIPAGGKISVSHLGDVNKCHIFFDPQMKYKLSGRFMRNGLGYISAVYVQFVNFWLVAIYMFGNV